MLINNFFNLQLYVLGAGWLINSSLQNNSEKWCYFKKKDLILLYLTKSIVQIKKNLFLIQTIKKYKGTFFFINSYFYYFKNIHFFCFNIRENLLQVYFKGYFSNYLCYKKKKMIPDLLFFFNTTNHYVMLKELKQLGLPVIALIENSNFNYLVEYPININKNSYFINFLLLHFYSKYLILNY